MEPPIEPPPFSTTSLPSDADPSEPPPPAAPRPPVLASEMLREEVAPIAPSERTLRIWLTAFAVAYGLEACASALGFGPPFPGVVSGSVATALAAATAALVPVPYAFRASLAAVAGLVPLLLGLNGLGPLAAVGFDGFTKAAAALVAATLLPGVLLFRSRYRAFRAARWLLAIALLAAAPAVVLAGHATMQPDVWPVRAANGALVLAVATAFFGFMGEETTGACTAWAASVVVAYAGRLVAQRFRFVDEPYGHWGFVAGAIGAAISVTVVAFALFQLLAALLASQARKVDVHRAVGAGAERPRSVPPPDGYP